MTRASMQIRTTNYDPRDSYSRVTLSVQAFSSNAIGFTKNPAYFGQQDTIWIPKSIIHGADLMALESQTTAIGDRVSVRIMSWKAEELGL